MSELGLHCFHKTLQQVSGLKCVKAPKLKIHVVEFACSVVPDEVDHNESPHLDLGSILFAL